MSDDLSAVRPEDAPLATPEQRRANLRLGLLLGGFAIAIAVLYMLLLPKRFAQAVAYHQAREAERKAEPVAAPADRTAPAPTEAAPVPSRGSP